MRQKITASVVAKLNCPSEKAQAWVRDSEVSGFAVRITNKGVKSFVFERRPKGVAKIKQCQTPAYGHKRYIMQSEAPLECCVKGYCPAFFNSTLYGQYSIS